MKLQKYILIKKKKKIKIKIKVQTTKENLKFQVNYKNLFKKKMQEEYKQ
jgi:hypothetical protein